MFYFYFLPLFCYVSIVFDIIFLKFCRVSACCFPYIVLIFLANLSLMFLIKVVLIKKACMCTVRPFLIR